MLIPLKDENPTRRFAWVNVTLIVANVAVFIYELTQGANLNSFLIYWGFRPSSLLASPLFGITRIFTSMFLHAGFLHIGGNMLYLFIFGDNVEDILGHWRYLVFYLVSGIVASAAHILSSPSSVVPTVGASGAIAGVLGAYFVNFPRSRVLALIPIGFFLPMVEVPSIVFLFLWFITNLFSGVASLGIQAQGGVAWWAHIGGFVSGMVLSVLWRRRRVYA